MARPLASSMLLSSICPASCPAPTSRHTPAPAPAIGTSSSGINTARWRIIALLNASAVILNIFYSNKVC